jgi:formate/nitrite transporter FocA (FNT family)
MFIMMYTTLQRKTSIYDLGRNWVISYIFNIAGALFFAGFLAYWPDTLSCDAEESYAASQPKDALLSLPTGAAISCEVWDVTGGSVSLSS